MASKLKTKAGLLFGAVTLVGTGVVANVAPAGAAFPGANGKIACSTNRTGNFENFTFESTGPEINPTNITNSPGTDSRPRWRSDGRKIVFESARAGGTNLFISDADGSNVQQLTFTNDASSGAWHPDGSQIVYVRTIAGLSFEVYKINVDGTGTTSLASTPQEDSLPFWSPDGTTIAYSSRRQDAAADVHKMDSFGNNNVNLTLNFGVEDSWPNWSPDGSMITFHSRRLDAAGEEIYRMNADGSNVVQLTNLVGPFDIFPFWSPDGTRIGWNSQRQGAANFGEVFHMNAVTGALGAGGVNDETDVRRITNNAATDQRCDWQPLCTHYSVPGQITVGTEGNDIICGTEGDDRISALGGNDIVYGFGGNDQLSGGAGDDRMFGGIGDDSFVGGAGVDFTSGGPGADRFAADATDRIDPGAPGANADQCVVGAALVACPARLS
jgi:Tol biopolymer transport system component